MGKHIVWTRVNLTPEQTADLRAALLQRRHLEFDAIRKEADANLPATSAASSKLVVGR